VPLVAQICHSCAIHASQRLPAPTPPAHLGSRVPGRRGSSTRGSFGSLASNGSDLACAPCGVTLCDLLLKFQLHEHRTVSATKLQFLITDWIMMKTFTN
jgi:hypothetical protein